MLLTDIHMAKHRIHISRAIGWKKKSIMGVGLIRPMITFLPDTPCQWLMRPAIVFVLRAKSSSVGVVSAFRYHPGESREGGLDRGEYDPDDVLLTKLGRFGDVEMVVSEEGVLETMCSMLMAVCPFSTRDVVFMLYDCSALRCQARSSSTIWQ